MCFVGWLADVLEDFHVIHIVVNQIYPSNRAGLNNPRDSPQDDACGSFSSKVFVLYKRYGTYTGLPMSMRARLV